MKKFDVFSEQGEKIMTVAGEKLIESSNSTFAILNEKDECIFISKNGCYIVQSDQKDKTVSDAFWDTKLLLYEIEHATGFVRNIVSNIKDLFRKY